MRSRSRRRLCRGARGSECRRPTAKRARGHADPAGAVPEQAADDRRRHGAGRMGRRLGAVGVLVRCCTSAMFRFMAPHQTQLQLYAGYDRENLYFCYTSPVYPEDSWLKARGRFPDMLDASAVRHALRRSYRAGNPADRGPDPRVQARAAALGRQSDRHDQRLVLERGRRAGLCAGIRARRSGRWPTGSAG